MTPAVSSSSPSPSPGSVKLTAPKKITGCALPIIWGLGSLFSLAAGGSALKITAAVTILGTAATPVGWGLIGLGVFLGGVALCVYVRNRKNAQLESRINAFCDVSDNKNQIVDAWEAYNRYKTGNQSSDRAKLHRDYTTKYKRVRSTLENYLHKRLSNLEFQVIRENWFSQLDQAAPASAAPAAPASAASAPASAAASTSRKAKIKKTPYEPNEIKCLANAFSNPNLQEISDKIKGKLEEIKNVKDKINSLKRDESSSNAEIQSRKAHLKNLRGELQNLKDKRAEARLLARENSALLLARKNPALFSKLLMSFISNPEHFNQEVHALSTNPTRLAALMEMVDFKDIKIMEVEEFKAMIDLTLNLLEHLKSYSLISLKDANYFKKLLISYKDLLNTYDAALTSLDSSQSLESEERSLLIQEKLEMTVQETCLLIHNHWDDHNLQELHRETIEAINDFCRSIAD